MLVKGQVKKITIPSPTSSPEVDRKEKPLGDYICKSGIMPVRHYAGPVLCRFLSGLNDQKRNSTHKR